MRVAVAGCSGHINYVFAALKEDPSLQVTAFCSFAEENPQGVLAKLAEMGQTPKIYDTYQQMVLDAKCEVAVAAAPLYLNAGIAIEALNKGLPVFCEKPVALTLDSLKEVEQAQRAAQKPICSMMGLRRDPHFYAAKKAVEQGAVGEIIMTTAQKSYRLGNRAPFYSKRETYGGTIPWVGIHAIDWIYWYTGRRFERVTAAQGRKGNGGNGDMESSAAFLYTFREGGYAGANIDFLRPAMAPTHGDDRVRIAGTEGVIEVRHGAVTLLRNDAPEKTLDPLPCPGVFTEFARHIKGEGENPVPTEDSFYVTAAALLTREAADRDETVSFSDFGL